VENLDPFPYNGGDACVRIFRFEVWRGWNRRVEVRHFSMLRWKWSSDLSRSLRPLVISLIPGQEKQLDKLKEMRRQLQKEVSDTIDEFGPKLYEDFDDVRWPPHFNPFTDQRSSGGCYRLLQVCRPPVIRRVYTDVRLIRPQRTASSFIQ
jgi:hypothetical protein